MNWTKKALWTRLPFASLSLALLAVCLPASAHQRHTIKSGETLGSIARKYHVEVKEIAAWNGLKNTDKLSYGVKILIPTVKKETAVRSKKSPKVPAPTKWVARTTKPAPKLLKRVAKWTPAKTVAKWTPPKSSAKKAVVKTAAPKWKHAAKLANDRAWKAAYAKQVAEARRAARQKHELAKIVRSAPRVAKRYNPEASAPEANTDIVRSAYSYRGTPYRYGGSARGGFDCSGFTSYLYRQKGVSLPHSARAQAQMGQSVSKKDLKAGDLVFFHTVTPGISHVGMYVGDGKFVHASSRRSGGVRVDSLNSGYYNQRLRGARRYSR